MSVSERIEGLQQVINRSQQIVDGLSGNAAWDGVLEDFEHERQRLDDSWAYVTDPAKMIEFRAAKMAVVKVLNIIDDYKRDINTALEEKVKLENPDHIIQADVDNA
jgi:hypothetical protein